MEEPPSLKLEDAIISFNAQVMNLDTVQDLFDASFSYRLVGACGIRFYASGKRSIWGTY